MVNRPLPPTGRSPRGVARRNSGSWPGRACGACRPASAARRPAAGGPAPRGAAARVARVRRRIAPQCRPRPARGPCGGRVPPVGTDGSGGPADQVAQLRQGACTWGTGRRRPPGRSWGRCRNPGPGSWRTSGRGSGIVSGGGVPLLGSRRRHPRRRTAARGATVGIPRTEPGLCDPEIVSHPS